MNVLEMKRLRSMVAVSQMDRARNEEVRRTAGILLFIISKKGRQWKAEREKEC